MVAARTESGTMLAEGVSQRACSLLAQKEVGRWEVGGGGGCDMPSWWGVFVLCSIWCRLLRFRNVSGTGFRWTVRGGVGGR